MTLSVDVALVTRAGFRLEAAFSAGDETVALLGPSGSGKSLLLRTLAGLVRPDRGRIALGERVQFDAAEGIDRPARERRIGMVFQHQALFPHRTVAGNILFPLAARLPAQRSARLAELVDLCRLAGLEDRLPTRLSGGERQRVALARALAADPEALLLDEPFSALDAHLRAEVEITLGRLLGSFGGTSLLVTHDVEEAWRLASRFVVLVGGRVAADGPREEVFSHPPTTTVARITGCKNLSRATPTGERTATAPDWGGAPIALDRPWPTGATHVGIRANHVVLVPPGSTGAIEATVVATGESPFRQTLFLRIGAGTDLPAEGWHLRVEQPRGSGEPAAAGTRVAVLLAPSRLFATREG